MRIKWCLTHRKPDGSTANTIIIYLESSRVAPSSNVLQLSLSFCIVGTSLMCVEVPSSAWRHMGSH